MRGQNKPSTLHPTKMWEDLEIFYSIPNRVRKEIMILISTSFESFLHLKAYLTYLPCIAFGSWCNNENDNFEKNENSVIDFD